MPFEILFVMLIRKGIQFCAKMKKSQVFWELHSADVIRGNCYFILRVLSMWFTRDSHVVHMISHVKQVHMLQFHMWSRAFGIFIKLSTQLSVNRYSWVVVERILSCQRRLTSSRWVSTCKIGLQWRILSEILSEDDFEIKPKYHSFNNSFILYWLISWVFKITLFFGICFILYFLNSFSLTQSYCRH